MPEQKKVKQLGGTMRLGKYPCHLDPESKAAKLYGEELIYERHRHRFEVNNDYRDRLEQAGVLFAGKSPDNRIVEMMELPEHPVVCGGPVPSGIQIAPQSSPSVVPGLCSGS